MALDCSRIAKVLPKCLLGAAVMIFCAGFLPGNNFVEVTRRTANIRSAPTTSGQLVAKATQGDVFILEAEEGDWYRIHMFSGGSRYLFKNLARVVSFDSPVPEDPALRREVYDGWFAAEEKAKAEANRRYPREKNLEKHLDYLQLLTDRYKLDLMHRYNVSPASYRKIILEGNMQGWRVQE